jgi:isoleucyl-tRNA synthetase
VVPRLLLLIDELTNWYIRFNRARLKGEGGSEDTTTALNTLFETLYTLCRTMVSVPPSEDKYSFTDRLEVVFHTFHHREPISDTKEIPSSDQER